jgi:hypothetical protein
VVLKVCVWVELWVWDGTIAPLGLPEPDELCVPLSVDCCDIVWDWLGEPDRLGDWLWVCEGDAVWLGEPLTLGVCDVLGVPEADGVPDTDRDCVCEDVCVCVGELVPLLDCVCDNDCDTLGESVGVCVCDGVLVPLFDCDCELVSVCDAVRGTATWRTAFSALSAM